MLLNDDHAVHLLQNRLDYSKSAIEETLHETAMLHQFSDFGLDRILDATAMISCRWLLEQHELTGDSIETQNNLTASRKSRGQAPELDSLQWR